MSQPRTKRSGNIKEPEKRVAFTGNELRSATRRSPRVVESGRDPQNENVLMLKTIQIFTKTFFVTMWDLLTLFLRSFVVKVLQNGVFMLRRGEKKSLHLSEKKSFRAIVVS